MRFLVLILIIFTFNFGLVFSLECSPDQKLILAEFSLNDDSFSKDFDGNSGIIQRIKLNESDGKYSLWQTSNLNYLTDKGGIYSKSGDISFSIDSYFYSNRNNMLVIDPSIFPSFMISTKTFCRFQLIIRI